MNKTPPKKKRTDAAPAASEKTEPKAKVKPTFKHTYCLLKSAVCKKLSQKASGGIGYDVLADPGMLHLSIRITDNVGGGYYSREIVPFAKVMACMDNVQKDKPFPSKIFKGAFTGRSSNNAGFLAAVLRAEGLLLPAPDTDSQHTAAENWSAWEKTMLAGTGELIEIELPVPADNADDSPKADDAPQPESRKTLTLKRPKTDAGEKAED